MTFNSRDQTPDGELEVEKLPMSLKKQSDCRYPKQTEIAPSRDGYITSRGHRKTQSAIPQHAWCPLPPHCQRDNEIPTTLESTHRVSGNSHLSVQLPMITARSLHGL